MLTPEGLSANKMDKIMLLGIWAKFLAKEHKKESSKNNAMIYAGMGKPTYPLHPYTGKFLADYWSKHPGDAINYGDPQGDVEARDTMSKAMSHWYKLKIKAGDILFTVGGAGALHSIFSALKSYYADTPNFRVITPFPYYTLYAENDLRLHPIHVMNQPGYRLTAESIVDSIQSAHVLAKTDGGYPLALLLCDPNNPLGTLLGVKELKKIAQVLRGYPKLTIILDEAYAEMVLDGTQHVSLLSVAPDLKNRIIIMRSATKGLSAAGERMAVTITFNKELMTLILENSIRNYGHAPRSLQMAYAKTMEHFSESQRIKINNFYRQKVEYVNKKLTEIGALMPDPSYHVKSTFYILADFHELLGEQLPKESLMALEKYGAISSDEDIAYALLFNEAVMVAPGSYYGMEKNKGYIRITCSAHMDELHLLMDRLESRLRQARLNQQKCFKQTINEQLTALQKINKHDAHEFSVLYATIIATVDPSTLELKQQNDLLKKLLLRLKCVINQSTYDGKIRAAIVIQSAYRSYVSRKKTSTINDDQNIEWQGFVDKVSPKPSAVRRYLQKLTVAERLELAPWKERLKEKDNWISANFLFDMMNNPTLSSYNVFLLFVVIGSGVVGLSCLASMSIIGLSAASLIGVSAAVMSLGLFSQSIKTHILKEPSELGELNLCQIDNHI